MATTVTTAYKGLSLLEIVKLDGVRFVNGASDIGLTVAGKFAHALIAEASGDKKLAEARLNEAIALAETKS